MNIHKIFPLPVAKKSKSYELSEQEKNFLINQEKIKNAQNNLSANTYILESPILKGLKAYLESSVNEFFESVYSPASNCYLYITQSWVNYTNKGEQHHKHCHQNSFISGVFYIEANIEVDKIWVHQKNKDLFLIETKSPNEFNSPNLFLPVDEGETVMFPSSIEHSVQPVETENQRISLAFNTFLKGSIGNDASLNSLNLM